MATRTIIRRRPKIISKSASRTQSYIGSVPLADILTQIAYVFFAVLEGVLVLRFVLRLASADPFNGLVAWVYNATSLFVVPFEAMFPSPTNDASALEVSTLVAMLTYLFVFYLAIAIFRLFVPVEEVVNPEGEY